MWMKRILVLLLCLIPLWLCSWVNEDTVDVYTGTASINPVDVPVTNLGGRVRFYLSSYEGFGLSSSGYLINAGSAQRTGYLLAPNGGEYPCRFSVNSGLEIQQTYIQNNYERSVWVSYNLKPDIVPSWFTLPEIALITITILVFILAAVLIISRGAIL